MTNLKQALLEDPSAVFEIEGTLPSGNKMCGTVGPLIGNKTILSVTFSRGKASEEDIAIACQVLDKALGMEPALVLASNTPEERSRNIAEVRKFMGGGQG